MADSASQLRFDIDPADRKQLGKIIRAARDRAGMTQRDLARSMDISGGQVGMYENGSREPSWLRFTQAMEILSAHAYVSISLSDAKPS